MAMENFIDEVLAGIRPPDALNMDTFEGIEGGDSIDASSELPMLEEWAYDFENNELLLNDNGMPYLVSGNEALKIWLYFAMISERYKYLANSDDYGTEIDRMLGMTMVEAVRSSELERTVREAIEICPYVNEVKSIELEVEGGMVTINVSLQSIYDEGWVSMNVKF